MSIPADGNCGFSSVLAALAIAGRKLTDEYNVNGIRRSVSRHVQLNRDFYALKIVEHEQAQEEEAIQAAYYRVDRFTQSVLSEGLNGHWLGSVLGELELLAVANTFAISIQLYAPSPERGGIRPTVEVGPVLTPEIETPLQVDLLFSGRANSGHFDLLLPTK